MTVTGIYGRLKQCRALVVGDLMLDSYTFGAVTRISPEAPVPVVHVDREENLPGGAGNVALNLRALGAEVRLMARIGADSAGRILEEALEQKGCDLSALQVQQGFPTSVKNRVMAGSQQMLRVDRELLTPLDADLESDLKALLAEILADTDVVAISDYGKGFLTRSFLRVLIESASSAGVPVIVDPKGHDFTKYNGATIVKPNESEAFAAAGLGPEASLDDVATRILSTVGIDRLLVTRSEKGIAVFQRSCERQDFPVRVREVVDVTGAGDSVLAMLTVALASGLSIGDATELANLAAGLAIETIGCARVTLSQLARRLLDFNSGNKVFHGGHVSMLQQAIADLGCTLIAVDSRLGFSESLFETLHALRGRSPKNVVVVVEDSEPRQAFIDLLSSLSQVDFVMVDGLPVEELADCLGAQVVARAGAAL